MYSENLSQRTAADSSATNAGAVDTSQSPTPVHHAADLSDVSLPEVESLATKPRIDNILSGAFDQLPISICHHESGDEVTALRFYDGDRRALVTAKDGSIADLVLFNESQRVARTFQGLREQGHTATSRDGSLLLRGLQEETIDVLNLTGNSNGHARRVARYSHPDGIWAADFSPGNRYLALGVKNGVVVLDLQDLRNGIPTTAAAFHAYTYHRSPFHGFSLMTSVVKFSPGGDTLVCGGPRGHLWLLDLEDQATRIFGMKLGGWGNTPRLISGIRTDHTIEGVSFDPRGQILAATETGGRLQIIDLKQDGSILKQMQILSGYHLDDTQFESVEFSPDGKKLVLAGRAATAEGGWTGALHILDTEHIPDQDPSFIKSIKGLGSSCRATFSRDGTKIMTGTAEGSVDVYML